MNEFLIVGFPISGRFESARCCLLERKLQHLSRMQGLAVSGVTDLLATTEAIGDN